MRDEQVRQAELLLQIAQQIDDLRLNRDVQRRDRLVTEDEVGVQRERARNADTLALAAGELMRITALVICRQAAGLHNAGDIVVKFPSRHNAVLAHRLADDLTDRKTRRQAGIRVLEDDLNLGAHLAQLILGQGKDVLAVEVDLAVGLVLQAQDGSADGGLAAAGLADKAHGGTALDLKRCAVDSLDVADGHLEEARLDGEILFQILDNQQVLRVFFSAVKPGSQECVVDFVFRICHIKAPPHSQISDNRAPVRPQRSGSRRRYACR